MFTSRPEEAVELARSVKLAATDRARFGESDLSWLHGPTRGPTDRVRAVWSILRGGCRIGDVWSFGTCVSNRGQKWCCSSSGCAANGAP